MLALVVFTPVAVLAPDPRATLLATAAVEFAPSAMALVFEATALLPIDTEEVPLEDVPPMPIAMALVPVAVLLDRLVFTTR